MGEKPLIVIVGPTAVGKTDISIKVAKALDCEIISADSMQIYKYMDIGTAKPTLQEREGVPHHLMDFLDPADDFSVVQFQSLALEIIEKIHQKGKIPMVVGGTGLYVNSLVYPMNFTEAQEDPDFRQHMQEQADVLGKEFLYTTLAKIDPETAKRLHPNDVRRIIRALEIHHLTGKTMSHYRQDFERAKAPYNLVMIGLTMDRQKLYKRIEARIDKMVKNGLLDEVKGLLDHGYSVNMTSMQGLGYKEMAIFIHGKASFNQAVEILKRNTRRFAKRQITWFKRDKRILWIDVESFASKELLANWIITHIKKKLSLN